MSVATQLELDDPGSGLLAAAHDSWPSWVDRQEALGVVAQLGDLPTWLGTHPQECNAVLGALSGLAAQHDGDDVPAAAALAWLLVPGASLLANRLTTLSPAIDQLVAAQLWIEVRTFGPGGGRRVAASILRNTRKGVLRDLGVGEHAELAWRRRLILEPDNLLWQRTLPLTMSEDGGAGELSELLEAACAQSVISDEDLHLLLGLAQAADAAAQSHFGRGCAGLMTPVASMEVAQRWGVSARTVRRRARRSLDALSRYAVTQMSA
ncbi:hypothetical protein JNB_00830 [Janibacter sp. HTCC2649]|uniref:hypothetical protein n=1 Tax=Janibacter sp. HTCC2649 TaxID=313589 RepID=UPI000066EBFA|nr:hypothetical protein [Janibacter sp. HTCC2649]EAP98668.1 hypothetical protein JNB_00830 [Janibacter sp. HTCC2649]